MGKAQVPKWLGVDAILSQFGIEREEVRQHYRRFVLDGVGQGIWEELRQQIYLGSEAFVERMQAKVKIEGDTLSVPQAQHRPPAPTLADVAASHGGWNTAIMAAYGSYRKIAEHFNLHLATVGRIVRRAMQELPRLPAQLH